MRCSTVVLIWVIVQLNIIRKPTPLLYSQLDQCPRGEVYVPEDWTEIEDGRFQYCAGMRSVIIPDSVLRIGIRSFYHCHNLRSVDLGKGVQVIETESFQYCSALKTIHIPESVTVIGGAPLAGCTSLVRITVDQRNSYYMESEGVLFEMNRVIISTYQCPPGKAGSYKVPPYVSFIGNGSFAECPHLTSVELPEGIVGIAEYAFYKSVGLESVNIPSSCVVMKDYAFCYCESLRSIVLPDSITEVTRGLFCYCYNLTHVKFGNSTKNIGHHAFRNTKLGSITLPETLENIGIEAFAHSQLTSVDFGGCCVVIYGHAFSYCAKLETILNEGNISIFGDGSFMYCERLKSLDAMSQLMYVTESAFSHCTSLESFDTGPMCKALYPNAFEWCVNLKTVVFGESLVAIGEYAFSYCGLESVYIPAHLTDIRTAVFYGCEHLTEIAVDPNSYSYISYDGVLFEWTNHGEWDLLQYPSGRSGPYTVPAVIWYGNGNGDPVGCINQEAFAYAYKLTEVHIEIFREQYGIWLIDEFAFQSCTSLVSVTFPSTLMYIWNYAFADCTSLTEVYIPASVQELGVSPFYDCGNVVVTVDPDNQFYVSDGNTLLSRDMKTFVLYCNSDTFHYEIRKGVEIIAMTAFHGAKVTEVVIPDTVTTLELGCFSAAHIKSITLPDSIVYVDEQIFYKCHELEYIKLSGNMQSITAHMIRDCPKLKSIVIPDSVVRMEDASLCDCTSLKSVVFGRNVEYIGGWAFQSCISLTSAVLPALLTRLSYGLFLCCTMLESVVIGDSVRVIDGGVFGECVSLVSVNIPDSVEEVVDEAFVLCKSLRSIVLGENITTINKKVFLNCTALESVYLPASVVSLTDLAFCGCVALKNVTYGGTSEPSGTVNVFSGCALLIEVAVPQDYDSKTFLSFPVKRPGDVIDAFERSSRITVCATISCIAAVVSIFVEIVHSYMKGDSALCFQIRSQQSNDSLKEFGSDQENSLPDITKNIPRVNVWEGDQEEHLDML